MKRPAFQFYPGDWLHDTALRSCSVASRGLWIDLICIMHQAEPYGYLLINGRIPSKDILHRVLGIDAKDIELLIFELTSSGVLSTREDGCVFSRRMVKDEETRLKRALGGSLSLANKNVPGKKEGYPLRISSKDTHIGYLGPEDEDEDISLLQEILLDLNTVARKRYKLTEPYKKQIRGRLSDGATLQDFQKVHRIKTAQWRGTDMEKYLHPGTLYRASKFQGYVNEPENQGRYVGPGGVSPGLEHSDIPFS